MVAAQSGDVIDDGTDQPGVACNGEQLGAVTGMEAQDTEAQQAPCFDFSSLPDRLEEAGIGWRYYVAGGGAMILLHNSGHWADDFAPNEQFITNAQTGNLPAMSWIFSDGAHISEEPPGSICKG